MVASILGIAINEKAVMLLFDVEVSDTRMIADTIVVTTDFLRILKYRGIRLIPTEATDSNVICIKLWINTYFVSVFGTK